MEMSKTNKIFKGLILESLSMWILEYLNVPI